MRLIPVESNEQAGVIGASLIAHKADHPIYAAFPGGRSVVPIYQELARYPAAILEQLNVRIADERIGAERNEAVIREHLIEPAERRGATIGLRTPLLEGDRDAIIASYRETIDTETFDVVLLGVGEDGHVLGLYPGFPQLDSTEKVEAFDDSPKPPPERMTTTLRCYDPRRTRAIILFLGEGKRAAFEAFRREPDHHTIPAAYFAAFEDAYVITDLL